VFTGLIADLGTLEQLREDGDGAELQIATSVAREVSEGDSVAVNGVCLTACAADGAAFRAAAMNETLRRTALGALRPGARVNIELALRAEDRLGGHMVQGHVDGRARVEEVREDGFSRVVTLSAPAELSRYIVEKGSLALDGVSLTVSAVDGERFAVSLIPETLQRTNLALLSAGDEVNLEVDVLAKYVERLMEAAR